MQVDYELCYCAEGRRAYVLQDACVILQPGQSLLLPMREQKARPVDLTGRENGISVFFALGEHTVPDALYREKGACILQSEQIQTAFSVLMQKDIGKQMRRLKMTELLLLLQELDPAEMISPLYCSREDLALARAVFAYATAHLQERITVQMLAAYSGVSATRLKAAFSQVYGVPVMCCIRQEKMYRSALDLVQTDRRIIDIAQDAGYDNSSKFAHAFREVMGMLPGEYRRLHSD